MLAQTCFFHLRLRTRCHSKTCLCASTVATRLLQRSSCRTSSDDITASFSGCSARVVMELRASGDHVTLALRELHWSPVTQRIELKPCLLVHKSLVGHSSVWTVDSSRWCTRKTSASNVKSVVATSLCRVRTPQVEVLGESFSRCRTRPGTDYYQGNSDTAVDTSVQVQAKDILFSLSSVAAH